MTDWASLFTGLLAADEQPELPEDLAVTAPIPLAFGALGDYGYLAVREALLDGSFETKEIEFVRDEDGWRLLGWGGGTGHRDPLTEMDFSGQLCEIVSGRVGNQHGSDAIHLWFAPWVSAAATEDGPVRFGPFNHAVVFVPAGSESVRFDRVEGEGVPSTFTLDLASLKP